MRLPPTSIFVSVSALVSLANGFSPIHFTLKESFRSHRVPNGLVAATSIFSFCGESSSRQTVTALKAASAGGEEGNLGTLYDVLGCKPSDSYQTIRRKYTALAKKMHPDTSVDDKLDVSEFTQVVAAWKVLQDPKERLKYDRALKAKEFTDSMENFFDASIKTAIPFMKKTADTTIAAVETSSAAINDVSQKLNVARQLRDLDRKRTSLEQQALREEQQAKRLEKELSVIDKKKMEKLANTNIKLTYADAIRILDSFDLQDASRKSARQEIEALRNLESVYKEKEKQLQDRERLLTNAERSVENALARERLAKQKLEEAQQEAKQAKLNMESCQKEKKDATSQERTAQLEMEKASATLESNTEKVRTLLRKREGESLQRESTNLRKETSRLQDAALQFKREAEKIRIKANAIKRENEGKK